MDHFPGHTPKSVRKNNPRPRFFTVKNKKGSVRTEPLFVIRFFGYLPLLGLAALALHSTFVGVHFTVGAFVYIIEYLIILHSGTAYGEAVF